MKKIISTLIVIGLVSSCRQQEAIQPKKSYESEIRALNSIFDAAMDFSFKNFTNSISKTGKGQIDYDQKLSLFSTLESLEGAYFTCNNFQYSHLADNLSIVKLSKAQTLAVRLKDFNIDQYNSLSSEQIEIAGPFIYKLLSLESLELVSTLSSDFNSEIAISELSEDEKLELFALSAASNSLSKYLSNESIDIIYLAIEKNLSDNSSKAFSRSLGDYTPLSGGCSVNWRSVWLGGVVGFFGNGTAGAYAGCTGGTVLLPGVGTVTGCVAGAVFGATVGFVGGSLTGVASELLGSCFR